MAKEWHLILVVYWLFYECIFLNLQDFYASSLVVRTKLIPAKKNTKPKTP